MQKISIEEVDLLLERDGGFIAFEAKSAEMLDLKDLKGIRTFKRDYGEEFGPSFGMAGKFDFHADSVSIPLVDLEI